MDVLVVGTDADTQARITSLLEAQGLTVGSVEFTAENGIDVLVSQVAAARPKLIVVDFDRFEDSALDFLRRIFGGEGRLVVLILTALGQNYLYVQANRIRGKVRVDLQVKPFPADFFVRRVKSLLAWLARY